MTYFVVQITVRINVIK